MTDDLDRALSTADDLEPSSGFAAAVMEAIRREAVAPPPIPFPWLRAVPALLAVAIVLGAVAAGMITATPPGPASPGGLVDAVAPWGPWVATVVASPATMWCAATLGLVLASLAASSRLAGVSR